MALVQDQQSTSRCSCQKVNFQNDEKDVKDSSISNGLRIFWCIIVTGIIITIFWTWTAGYQKYWNSFNEVLRFLLIFFMMFMMYATIVHLVSQFRSTLLSKVFQGFVKFYFKGVSKVRHKFWMKILENFMARQISDADLVNQCLTSLYCSDGEVKREEKLIRDVTDKIQTHMTKVTKHSVLAINTGSVFERYGKPLSAATSETNLKSDYNVMFSFDGKQLPLKIQFINDEYVYLVATSEKCKVVQKLKDNGNEDKLNAGSARQFLQDIVNSLFAKKVPESLTHLNGYSANRLVRMFDYVKTSILINVLHFCSFKYWTEPVAVIKGPATNYTMKRLPHNPLELIRSTQYLPCLDFDFILSIDLPHWPESAAEWITRHRFWPSQAVVASVVATTCSVVPKTGPTGDPYCWRLSFSRGEVILSNHVSEHDRLAFLAVKLFYKEKLKPYVSFLRSYHLKTMFYHFLECKAQNEKDVNTTVFNMLSFVETCLVNRHCPHLFIRSINLFENCKTEAKEEFLASSSIIRDTLNNFPSSFYNLFSNQSMTDQFRNIFYKRYPTPYLAISLLTFLFGALFAYLSLVFTNVFIFYPIYLLLRLIVWPLCKLFGVNPDTSSHTFMTVILVTYVNRRVAIVLCCLLLFWLFWSYRGDACRYIFNYRTCVQYGL
jgi:hypothetical protein